MVLREARGIRYGTFVSPGNVLQIQADVIRIQSDESEFKIRGMVESATAIQGRLVLVHKNLAQDDPSLAKLDDMMIEQLRRQWVQLRRGLAA